MSIELGRARQLALVKTLAQDATSLSYVGSDHSNTLATILFNLAVEICLVCMADSESESSKPHSSFSVLWNLASTAFSLKANGSVLPMRSSMERLQKARNAAFHNGTPPASSSVQEYRFGVLEFLDSIYSKHFGVSFNSFCLGSLVENPTCRHFFQDVQLLIDSSLHQHAVESCLVFFHVATGTLLGRNRPELGGDFSAERTASDACSTGMAAARRNIPLGLGAAPSWTRFIETYVTKSIETLVRQSDFFRLGDLANSLGLLPSETERFLETCLRTVSHATFSEKVWRVHSRWRGAAEMIESLPSEDDARHCLTYISTLSYLAESRLPKKFGTLTIPGMPSDQPWFPTPSSTVE